MLCESVQEVPTVQEIEVRRQMSCPVTDFRDKHVPKVETKIKERIVNVPQVVKAERVVEVPQVQYVNLVREEAQFGVREIEKQIPKYTFNYIERVEELRQEIHEEPDGSSEVLSRSITLPASPPASDIAASRFTSYGTLRRASTPSTAGLVAAGPRCQVTTYGSPPGAAPVTSPFVAVPAVPTPPTAQLASVPVPATLAPAPVVPSAPSAAAVHVAPPVVPMVPVSAPMPPAVAPVPAPTTPMVLEPMAANRRVSAVAMPQHPTTHSTTAAAMAAAARAVVQPRCPATSNNAEALSPPTLTPAVPAARVDPPPRVDGCQVQYGASAPSSTFQSAVSSYVAPTPTYAAPRPTYGVPKPTSGAQTPSHALPRMNTVGLQQAFVFAPRSSSPPPQAASSAARGSSPAPLAQHRRSLPAPLPPQGLRALTSGFSSPTSATRSVPCIVAPFGQAQACAPRGRSPPPHAVMGSAQRRLSPPPPLQQEPRLLRETTAPTNLSAIREPIAAPSPSLVGRGGASWPVWQVSPPPNQGGRFR